MNFRLCAVLLLAAPLAAQTPAKRPMTFADLQAMKRVSDPQISPSGKWVLFSVTLVSLEQNTKTNTLWAVPLDGSAKEHVVSLAGSDARFSPDGKSVLSLLDTDGSIILSPWDEKDGTLGEGHGVRTIGSPADGLLWAPDSKHFLFSANVYPECESQELPGPGHNQQEVNCNAQKDAEAAKNPVKAQIFDHLFYRHWNAYVGPKHSHIFYGSTDPKLGPPTDLTPAIVIGDHEAPTFSLGGPLGYAISPDGKEVAYVTNLDKVPAESTNNDIFVLDPSADPSTAKKVSASPGSDDGPQYSPDGKYLAWRSQARNGYESDKFDLVVMDRANSAIRSITANFQNWVDEFVWVPNSKTLYFASASLGEEPIYSVGIDGSNLSKFEDPYLRAEFGSLVISADARILVASRMAVDGPSELVAFNTEHQDGWTNDPVTAKTLVNIKANHAELSAAFYPVKSQILTHLNDGILANLQLGFMESFFFEGAGGTHAQGFLIRPPNFDPTKKYPLKFLIHGGPQGAWGDAWSYRWNPELFAANGYVVVMINPRGSTGYGQKFLEQVSGDWGGRPYLDLMKGLDYAEAHYPFIDKSRECALGASYGGYMADWVLTHTHRFACIVTHDGMFNPQSAFGTTEELWFNEWEFRPLASASPDAVVEQTKPAHPWDFFDKPNSEDPFRKWSPMLNIKFAKTPTLVIHSQSDYRLDVSEGFQLFTALQLLHVPSKFLYFPDEGHWVLKPQNSELWYKTVNDWVDQWTHTNVYAK